MPDGTMIIAGAILLQITIGIHRWLHESNLGLLSGEEQLLLVKKFSGLRLTATLVPVVIGICATVGVWLFPSAIGWIALFSSIAILLFALFCQYFQIRRVRYFRMNREFVRAMWIQLIITEAGLTASLALLAFGIGGQRL